MNYSASIFVLSFLFLFISSPLVTSQSVLSPTAIQLIEKYCQQNQSVVVGIVKGDKTDIQGFGQLSRRDKRAPDAHTIYEIGALTEVFTTTLLAQQAQLGQVELGGKVENRLAATTRIPKYRAQLCYEVTFPTSAEPERLYFCGSDPTAEDICIRWCDLATHTSGLKGSFYRAYNWHPLYSKKSSRKPYLNLSAESFYQRLQQQMLNDAPGKQYQHSNLGIALLGNALAEVNQTSYFNLLHQQLLTPLFMKDTRINLTADQEARLATGHSTKLKKVRPNELVAFAPAGGLKSTGHDLVNFMRANLQTDYTALQDAFAEVHQSRIELVQYTATKSKRSVWMAYGWLVSQLNETTNQPVVWQSGGTNGFRAYMGFVKDTQTGVVILSNTAKNVEELGFELLEILHQKEDLSQR
ncbi:MAG: serine hydrolase domain-containing protein [Saprospiraceae bacterium]